jgi:hypothetical protein
VVTPPSSAKPTNLLSAFFDPSSEGREHRAERLAKEADPNHVNGNGSVKVNGSG